MGADTKKIPPLPAPTETDINTPTELSTELSKPGDEKSSYSIPEDGTPVTFRTRGHKANRSQTSLLIEYFEGGKSGSASGGQQSTSRRPSVRVRLTPSKKGRGDHIQLTETKGSRKASLTRRIPLDEAIASREITLGDGAEDALSSTSYASATEESNVSRNPIEVEIDHSAHRRRRRPASPLIPSTESYEPGNPSEISAIPADSFLDGSGPTTDLRHDASTSRGVEELAAAAGSGALAGAVMSDITNKKTRRGDRDRGKLTDKSSEKSERKRRPKSRTASATDYVVDESHSPRRRSGRGPHESTVSAGDSSFLSSNLSPSHRSFDSYSNRSGVSKTSINNPKLLETVEDAIRRLILPELSALKREQSKREGRRSSLTSTGTSASRDDMSMDRRRSSGARGDFARETPRHRERRNREARHDYDGESLGSPSRESLDTEYRERADYDAVTPRRSHNLLKTAAVGAAGAAAAAKALTGEHSHPDEKRQRDRRRRRAESARSQSVGRDQYIDEYEDDHHEPTPPMPLMSDINPSEMTRTSILSADTDRPHSASEEFATIHDVSRGVAPGDLTPTRSRSPVDLQHTLGTKYANISHGDLTALPRGKKEHVEEYETDEFGRKVPMEDYDYDDGYARGIHEPADFPEEPYDDGYYNTQDVPPPLKYVPYQAGARGLSPIPSVSGYTEGGSEAPMPRNSRSMQSISDAYSSPDKSAQHLHHSVSARSLNSIPSNMRSREFDDAVSADERSLRSPERRGPSYAENTFGGDPVRGFAANPNIVHPPMGVESAVASLVDGSMLEQSVLTSGSAGVPRDSNLSYESQAQAHSSHEESPDKMSIDSRHDLEEDRERHGTPGSRSLDHSQDVSEYEIDEHGRKVPRSRYRNSPTASEAAITAGAVGAAAAALKAAQERKRVPLEDTIEEEYQPAGVFRNKSFKERAMDGWEPRNTPAHSIDRLSYDDPPKMGISGMPDANDPMPEYGYGDDVQSTPSIVQDRLDGDQRDVDYGSGHATPTRRERFSFEKESVDDEEVTSTGDRGLGITEAAGAAALGVAAGMAAAAADDSHSREPGQGQDEWRRTSDERKRDTLITNPYEDTSPIVNPELSANLLGTRGLDPSYSVPYQTGSPGFGHKYDEGYMSNGPNRTPDIEPSGKAIAGMSGGAGTAGVEDPFYVPKSDARHLSGMSQGMGTPFYDAATGAGIDRIENKDIVALMQHLMVRDAQRSARDTELVALLMNSAIEMRTSFREMKDLIQDTGDDVIFANVENTEKLQKAINGPRPFPADTSRSIHTTSQAGTLDSASKKKNLWRRALEGLGARGASDLTRIEDMLMQLLGEVDVLKTQSGPGVSPSGQGRSIESLHGEGQYEQDQGYEPEGVSTASHASQSGHLSVPQTRPSANERKFSDHRVSTVAEKDEEYEYGQPSTAREQQATDPSRLTPSQEQTMRGASVPLETPPQTMGEASQQQPLSAENTPRGEKGKKHKAGGSSSWIPKISRWSGTTASSVGKAFRKKGNNNKYDDYQQPPSRSGSSLASYEEAAYTHDPYGADDKLHTGFSDPNLQSSAEPLGSLAPPQAAFMTTEDPKYKAHRNSLNLQHPQPRPGPSQRFQNALESSAQEYDSNDAPVTPRSADWAGSATSINRLPQNTQRYSNTSSAAAAARDAEYWQSPSSQQQQSGPPRPPKEPIEDASVHSPSRSNRTSRFQKASPSQRQQQDYEGDGHSPASAAADQYSGSPRFENRNLNAALGVPSRRPSGPRAMTPKSPEEDARDERRRKRATFGTVGSDDTDTF